MEARSNQAQPHTPPIAVQGLRKSFAILLRCFIKYGPDELMALRARPAIQFDMLVTLFKVAYSTCDNYPAQ